VRIEKGKCHCQFEWCVCIWFVNFEFCQRVITGHQAFNLSCHMKGQTCHCQSQSQVLVLPFYYLFINWLINETVRFSCDFSKTAMDDIYIYTTFQNKKDFDGEDIETNYPRESWYYCHHSIFSTRWGGMLAAIKAVVFNFILI